MPAIIDSAPDCVVSQEVDGTDEASVVASGEDSADFVVGDNYFSEETPCAGFMTFGPGSTYGEEGVGAEGAYMALTWIGIAFMVLTLIAWTLYERKRLNTYADTRGTGGSAEQAAAAAQKSELA
jgi:hypothetical protein